MRKITIGEVAERVREPDEDLLVVRDRLRFWVREGIIKPEFDPKAPGRHRYYGESAIICAGILSRLSHHYGISYASKQPMRAMFNVALEMAREVARNAREVAGEGPEIYLVLWSEGDGKKLSVHCNRQYIDLKSKSPRYIEILPQANDAIVINLTQLFRRIGVPLEEVEQLKRLQKKYPGYSRTTRRG
jgi:DNA-binding transcriptional MerR regulator